MKALLLFCTTLLLSSFCLGNNPTLEYYTKLVSQTIQAAEQYVAPKNNAEFAAGIYSNAINDFGEYDFIVIGAGSAGSVVATRLSEVSNWKILLLEAGGEENDFSNVPLLSSYLQSSEMNWGYYTTSQTNCCLGMKDQKCVLPQGKSIGGSSAINGLVYARGNSKDYDKWVALGNPGWSYEEVLPYFKKSENSQIDSDDFYHGKGGFWNVEHGASSNGIFQNFVDGNAELNISYVYDYNGRRENGVSRQQLNTKRGKRQSTGTAFLDNARKRKNLKVLTTALAMKVIVDSNSKAAQGVVFATDSRKFRATATKEVIVSAGAINSPRLLMLSGIGPKSHLENLEINVIEDLPVGENLIDHVLSFGLIFRTNLTTPRTDLTQILSQYLNGDSSTTVDGFAFTNIEGTAEDAPTIEYLCYPASGDPQRVKKALNFDDDVIDNYVSKINPATDIFIQPILLHEKSRGRVTLKSNDPIDFPDVDVNLLDEPEDVEDLIKAMKFVQKLSQTEAFKKINVTLLDFSICTDFEKFSNEFWECVVRHTTSTGYHFCGTAAMGPNKTSSVVDSNLKVHGVKNLRVVDASVFPSSLSGNTNAPTVMVAEKAADVIKSDYGVRDSGTKLS